MLDRHNFVFWDERVGKKTNNDILSAIYLTFQQYGTGREELKWYTTHTHTHTHTHTYTHIHTHTYEITIRQVGGQHGGASEMLGHAQVLLGTYPRTEWRHVPFQTNRSVLSTRWSHLSRGDWMCVVHIERSHTCYNMIVNTSDRTIVVSLLCLAQRKRKRLSRQAENT